MEDIQTQLLQNIHQEMINGSFSDIQVICRDGKTTGSRLVLAALSPFFRAMFTSDMAERRTSVLELPTVALSVFQDILKMYFCKINILDEDNCLHILDAAEMMQLDHIKQLCSIYLNQSLDLTPINCLKWWRILKVYNFLELSKRALSCFTDNLADFVKTENVIHLSKTELLEIISTDDLTCKEDDILKVAMKWIEHNNPKQEDVQSISESMRLDIVDRQFLVNEVAFSKIVLENGAVRKMIQKVLYPYDPRLPTIRSSLAKTPDVFVLHRIGEFRLSCFTSADKWEDVPPAPVNPGSNFSAVSLDGKICITGGDTQSKCTLVYDTIRKVWNVGPDLNLGHWYHCTATVRSKVYVIGGCDTNTIEEKSESEEQWQVVGDLGFTRSGAFPVTVGENILVMGGLVNLRWSDLIQCFNTTTGAVTKMNTKLPCTSFRQTGSVRLPDVYLLDIRGNVTYFHVIERNGEIHIENKLTAEWKPFGVFYDIVHRDGNLLSFTREGISKFNLAEGKKEESTFPEPPRIGYVFSALTI
ncbi:kelch-like protein 24 [Gigantopelta aegis]|uniref:kelch-like protein 24 n=1 Tax=Gigantopelta aegis TaxID=1735272 RepID=UPI001B88CDF8|nr:kelch-like protein 24 [Gigantopelta aegis]